MIKDAYGNTRFYGLYRGIVFRNDDPANRSRLQLKVPQVFADQHTGWAWSSGDNGTGGKVPDVGAGVWVMFEGGDPSYPVWVGAFNSYLDVSTEVQAVVGPQGPVGPQGATGSALSPVTVDYSPVWSGTGLAYTGTPATGQYVQMGNLVFFNIKVLFSTVTNFGTGQYSLTLPIAPSSDYIFRDGGVHQSSTHYNIAADADAGSTTVHLYHVQNTSGSNSYAYDDPFNGTNPVNLTTTGYMYVSGIYIASS